MGTQTTNLKLTLPTVDLDTGWGTTLNSDFTIIDNVFAADGKGFATPADTSGVGLQVGSGKTLTLGGTLILGSNDDTATPAAPTIRGAAVADGTTDKAGPNINIYAANGTGTGGSGAIVFRTAPPASSTGSSPNVFQAALAMLSSGNVGINTSIPAGLLDVRGNSTASANNWVFLRSGNVQATLPSTNAPVTTGNGFFIGTNYTGNKESSLAWDATRASSQYMVIQKWDGTTLAEQVRINGSGAIGLAGANYGTSGQVLTSGGSAAAPTWTSVSTITQGTSVSPSATGNLFTGIPSTAKMVILTFSGISAVLSNPVGFLVTVGSGTTPLTTGYTSSGTAFISAGNTPQSDSSTAGLLIFNTSNYKINGSLRLTKVSSPTGNLWVSDYTFGTDSKGSGYGGGTINVTGGLGCLRIAPATGTMNTTGTINITYM